MEITDSVLDLIGNTPAVRLRRVTEGLASSVVAKLETTNPGGSAKDRPALAMIDAAERDGSLRPGGTIVEPTSGNTGVGLAIVAAHRGYRCVFVVNDKVAPEKLDLLRAYGAEVVVCPGAVAPADPRSYYSTAARLAEEIPDAFRPDQYSNPANPESHARGTGPEIWRQTGGRVTHFVAGAGTGGTLTGVGRYLKAMNPAIQVVAADPEGSVYSGGSGRPYLVEGVGEDFWPVTYDRSVVDRVIAVSDRDSFLAARQVTEREGLLIGGSGGTAVAASLQLASELTAQEMVVVLIPDSGRGYLSRIFNDEWMAGYGFLTAEGPVVADVLAVKEQASNLAVPSLLYVQPGDRVRVAADLLHQHDVSQLPVAMGEMPLAAAEVVGSIDELRIMEAAYSAPAVLDRSVQDVMSPRMPTIGIGQPVGLAVQLLDLAPALLVLDGGRPRTVVARSDLLAFLSLDPAKA
jgi:cystathionine beta-synthase